MQGPKTGLRGGWYIHLDATLGPGSYCWQAYECRTDVVISQKPDLVDRHGNRWYSRLSTSRQRRVSIGFHHEEK